MRYQECEAELATAKRALPNAKERLRHQQVFEHARGVLECVLPDRVRWRLRPKRARARLRGGCRGFHFVQARTLSRSMRGETPSQLLLTHARLVLLCFSGEADTHRTTAERNSQSTNSINFRRAREPRPTCAATGSAPQREARCKCAPAASHHSIDGQPNDCGIRIAGCGFRQT